MRTKGDACIGRSQSDKDQGLPSPDYPGKGTGEETRIISIPPGHSQSCTTSAVQQGYSGSAQREAAQPGLLGPSPCPYTNSSSSRTDRVSIRSYRTDISMSDFENSREFGANDNMGASSITQETSLGGKDGMTLTQGNAQPLGRVRIGPTSGLGKGG